MVTNTADERDEMVAADEKAPPCAMFVFGDDEVVIYERENCQAWIQSSAVALEEYR